MEAKLIYRHGATYLGPIYPSIFLGVFHDPPQATDGESEVRGAVTGGGAHSYEVG